MILIYQLYGGTTLLMKLYSTTSLALSIIANFLICFFHGLIITELILIVLRRGKAKTKYSTVLITSWALIFVLTTYGILLRKESMGIFKVY